MFPVIDLGPFAIQAPGLILILSLLIGTWLTGKLAATLGTNGESIENSFLIALIAGILSARIGFHLQNPSIFVENPLSLFSLTPTMLNANFGILVAVLAAFIVAQNNHLPLWPTLDTLTPLILLIFMGVNLANFASGDAFGLPTSLPWGVRLWGEVRHPVQLYALLLALVVFIWLLIKTRGLTVTSYLQSGTLTLVIIAVLSGITLFIRAFVAEKITVWQFDIVQLGAFILMALTLWWIYRKTIQTPKQARVIISLGSNKDPHANLSLGFEKVSELFEIKRSSSIYQTIDVTDRKGRINFLNQAVEIKTSLSFPKLRESLKEIEGVLGRERGNKKVVPLDLDILTYNNDVFFYQHHQIPDPDLIKYRYLAEPLAEMSPAFRHPANGKSIQEILKQMKDETQVKKVKEVANGTQG